MNSVLRLTGLAALAVAASAALWFVARHEEPAPPPADTALEDEVKRLRREVAELRQIVERRPRARAEAPEVSPDPVPETAVPRGRRSVTPDDAGSSRVATPPETATISDLVARLRRAVVVKRSSEVTAAEAALTARGAEAVEPLMNVARDLSEPDDVRDAALRVLGTLRAPGLASLVENLYFGSSGTNAARRSLALRSAVTADAEAATAVVQRLLWSSDAADRDAAIAGLSASRDPAMLPLMREQVMRPDAGPSAVALSDAIAVIRGRRWSPVQATGAPDVPAAGDIGAAWTSKQPDMGEVTLDLDFEIAVIPGSVRIRETYNAGAVARIEAVLDDGTRQTLWEGRAPVEPAPRWFEPQLTGTASRVRTIRLVLDTNRGQGWNEIDAVELVGDGRRQWATAARASSSYSDP